MFIIENEAGEKVDQWKSGKNPVWPNGASMSGTATDGMTISGYTAYEVAQLTEGEGPRNLGYRDPEKVNGKWQRVKLVGAELPPPPDPQGTDENAEGYDEDYADNYKQYRQRAYPSIDEITVALWEKTVEDRADAADAVEVLRQAVKTRFPAPE